MIETREQRVLDPDVAADYCGALGCTRAWLVLGEGDPPTADEVRAAVEAARARVAAAAESADAVDPRPSQAA